MNFIVTNLRKKKNKKPNFFLSSDSRMPILLERKIEHKPTLLFIKFSNYYYTHITAQSTHFTCWFFKYNKKPLEKFPIFTELVFCQIIIKENAFAKDEE
jgi:hypothetical protein